MTKSSSDFLWLGSAMEGLTCATLLLEYLHADVGHIVSRPPPVPESAPTSPTSETPPPLQPKSTVQQVIERYAELVQHYTKVSTTSNVPMPSLIYAETCIKMGRFLLTVYVNGGWSDKVLSLLIQGKLQDTERKSRFLTLEEMNTYKESGIARHEIAEWVTKVWAVPLDEMPLLDQVWLL